MFRLSTLVLASTWLAVASAQQPQLRFTPVPAEQSGLGHRVNSDAKLGNAKYPWMSPPVDINGDGHLDVIVYGHHGGGAAIWLGKGDGAFQFDDSGYTPRWAFGGRDPVWLDLRGKGAADGIGSEGAGLAGRLFLNDGKGAWQKTNLAIGGTGIGGFQLADLDGDGRHHEIFITGAGAALKTEPALPQWAVMNEKLTARELWTAEPMVGWPKGIERGAGPGRASFRDAYTVDLDGDDQNELVPHLKGSDGFDTQQLFTWLLVRDGQTWKDVTSARGLPTEVGHWLFPEDINVDGSLDLVDLHTGQWYRNDGKGGFQLDPQRLFDANQRLSGRKDRPWTADCELQWLDLDNNGHRDFVSASDHGGERAAYLNLGGGRWAEVPGIPGSRRDRKFGDVNGDHRIDMITFTKDQVALHKNETPHHGLHVRLAPRVPAEGFLGVKLWVYEPGKLGDPKALIHYRQGFMERDAGRSNVLVPLMHVGLASRTAADVRVRFPSGVVKEVRAAKAGTQVVVQEE